MKLKKNEKYLFITDLDGTFLSESDGSIHVMNHIAAKKIKEAGHQLVIATGRGWWWTKMIYEQLKLDGAAIQYSGAHIHHPKDDSFKEFKKLIPRDFAIQKLREHNIPEKAFKIQFNGIEKTADLMEDSDLDHINFDPGEIAIFTDPGLVTMEEVKKINEEFGQEIHVRKYDGRVFEKDYITISAPGTQKGTAIEYVANYYNIPQERVIYFGDNTNDIEALEWAGISIVPQNAKDFAKERADVIIPIDNRHGGVAKYMIKMIEEAE